MQTNSPIEARSTWPAWSEFLRSRGLEGLAAWVLEAAGPLTVLGAQALYLGSPLLRPMLPEDQVEALAGLLEDPEETHAFTSFLREKVSS